jgi:lysophospholipid acyltransferase (LPLAT)-like uncharacterized protein
MSAGRRESWRTRALRALLAPLVALVLRALGATWRIETIGENPFAKVPPGAILAAQWHEDILITAVVFRDRGGRTPVSRSRDGEHIAAVLRHLGFREALRGSSSRGASAALRGVVRAIEQREPVSMMVDGPRGPARVAKVGVVAAARLSGEPLLPVALVSRPCIRFRSWDRTQLPLPFARVVVGFGERMAVDRGASDEEQERMCAVLDRKLAELHESASAQLAGHPAGNHATH